MTEKELDKLDNQETIAMLKEIDENYSSLDLPIVEIRAKIESSSEIVSPGNTSSQKRGTSFPASIVVL